MVDASAASQERRRQSEAAHVVSVSAAREERMRTTTTDAWSGSTSEAVRAAARNRVGPWAELAGRLG